MPAEQTSAGSPGGSDDVHGGEGAAGQASIEQASIEQASIGEPGRAPEASTTPETSAVATYRDATARTSGIADSETPAEAGATAAGDALPRREFFRTFVGEAVEAVASAAAAAGGMQSGLRGEAAALAAAAGIGFGETVVVDAPVAPEGAAAAAGQQPSFAAARPAAYRSPYRAERNAIVVLDQRRFPTHAVEVPCLSVRDAASAIHDGIAQGPGTIAAVAAYGLGRAAAARSWLPEPAVDPLPALRQDGGLLVAAAPHMTPLRRALDRLLWRAGEAAGVDWAVLAERLADEADALLMDQLLELGLLGGIGGRLLAEAATRLAAGPDRPLRLLVHGPVGALAYGQLGPVTSILTSATGLDVPLRCWLAEGRPSGSGERLAWELAAAGVPHDVVADAAVGGVMAAGAADIVLLGSFGVTAEGAVVDQPGAYAIAALAARHGLPVYVCLLRSALFAEPLRPSPAADLVPADLVSGFVTAAGIVGPPFAEGLPAFLAGTASGDASGDTGIATAVTTATAATAAASTADGRGAEPSLTGQSTVAS